MVAPAPLSRASISKINACLVPARGMPSATFDLMRLPAENDEVIRL